MITLTPFFITALIDLLTFTLFILLMVYVWRTYLGPYLREEHRQFYNDRLLWSSQRDQLKGLKGQEEFQAKKQHENLLRVREQFELWLKLASARKEHELMLRKKNYDKYLKRSEERRRIACWERLQARQVHKAFGLVKEEFLQRYSENDKLLSQKVCKLGSREECK